MRDLPSGTVTLLFTDIEGSTRLLDELGDAYADVLAEHRRVLREAFSSHGGVEVDTQGDAFFYAFVRAGDAVAAAGAGQGALAAGPVERADGRSYGRAARDRRGIRRRRCAPRGAHHERGPRRPGGRVRDDRQLLDETTRLRDLGDHRLKDLGAPQRLFQLGDGEFPPLKTLYRTTLPIQATPIVGRERELEEAGALVRAHRLLTLTGPGGSGKTRLAMQVAAEAIEQFPDGVFWVPLQALREPALVEGAIGAAVGADGPVIDYIGGKRLLLLLDNFEQIVEAAPTVSSLLSETPDTKVLVTSREPLQIESEQRYPVEPLPDGDAVALFVERAAAVEHGFRATEPVGEICRRLDGLPLAIELAAARVALLSPDELLTRLDKRLPLLASRSRDAPARQQTLRATIEWSYELLEPAEQELFSRLAVFRGSFALEAAESICGADLDVLESLVVKNLVRRLATGRLLLLDTIREYAVELLEASAEAETIRRRHAELFLELGVNANLDASDVRRGGQRLDIAIADIDDFRGALAWTVRSGSIELGLAIATAVEQMWVCHRSVRRDSLVRTALRPSAGGLGLRPCAPARFGRTGAHSTSEVAPIWPRMSGRRASPYTTRGTTNAAAQPCSTDSESPRCSAGDLERARVRKSRSAARSTAVMTTHFGRAETTGTLGAIARESGDDGHGAGARPRKRRTRARR